MKSALKKTKNWFSCIGQVYENGLQIVDYEKKQYDDEGNEKGKKKCKAVKGQVAIDYGNGVQKFSVFFAQYDGHGKVIPQWKMACNMVEWNPVIDGDTDMKPTIAQIQGSIDTNDYVGANGRVYNGLRWRVSKASTTNLSDTDFCCSISGDYYIDKIEEEENDEEPTGRLKVSLYGVNGNGEIIPYTMFVEEDSIVFFDYEESDTVYIEMELKSRHIGEKKRNGFRGKRAKANFGQGFDIAELVYSGSDDAYEEPDDEDDEKAKWINPETMAKAVRIRKKKLDEMTQSSDKENKGNSSRSKSVDFKARKAAIAAKSSRTKKTEISSPIIEDDDELPFDDEEDFDDDLEDFDDEE